MCYKADSAQPWWRSRKWEEQYPQVYAQYTQAHAEEARQGYRDDFFCSTACHAILLAISSPPRLLSHWAFPATCSRVVWMRLNWSREPEGKGCVRSSLWARGGLRARLQESACSTYTQDRGSLAFSFVLSIVVVTALGHPALPKLRGQHQRKKNGRHSLSGKASAIFLNSFQNLRTKSALPCKRKPHLLKHAFRLWLA